MTAICPKCGREYNCPPAISREDNETEICPVCGVVESLAPLQISDEEKERLIADAEQAELENGRVKPTRPQTASSSDAANMADTAK